MNSYINSIYYLDNIKGPTFVKFFIILVIHMTISYTSVNRDI